MAAQTSTPKLKRFADSDSDSAETFHSPVGELAASLHHNVTEVANTTASEDSDSDAPPEAVSTSAAHQATLSAAKRAANTRKHASEASRAKRQQLDASRVQQTQSRRKRGAETEAAEPAQPDDELPDELPAEIIAAAEAERAAKPLQLTQELVNREAERLLREEKEEARRRKMAEFLKSGNSTRTVRLKGRGNTRVKVLPKASTALPPRATVRRFVAKEAWLSGSGAGGAGGRGKDPAVVGSGVRKPWKSGFVVK